MDRGQSARGAAEQPPTVLLTVPDVSAVCATTLVAELGTPKDYWLPDIRPGSP